MTSQEKAPRHPEGDTYLRPRLCHSHHFGKNEQPFSAQTFLFQKTLGISVMRKPRFCLKRENLNEEKFLALYIRKMSLTEKPGEILCEKKEFLSGWIQRLTSRSMVFQKEVASQIKIWLDKSTFFHLERQVLHSPKKHELMQLSTHLRPKHRFPVKH